MRYLGEYVIPIAALILALGVELIPLSEMEAGWRALKRFVKQRLEES